MKEHLSETHKNPELAHVAIDSLVSEVMRRRDELLMPQGWLTKEAFDLADFLGTRVCVDGIPARVNDQNDVELMAIRRNTGPYTGKLTLIGGGVGRVEGDNDEWVPESTEEALRRHFKADLGLEIEPVGSWQKPDFLAQEMRAVDGLIKPNFFPNPNSRHLIAARYIVSLKDDSGPAVFGSTEFGGQEASDVIWFTEPEMPESSEFGYGHDVTYRTMFPVARDLLIQ